MRLRLTPVGALGVGGALGVRGDLGDPAGDVDRHLGFSEDGDRSGLTLSDTVGRPALAIISVHYLKLFTDCFLLDFLVFRVGTP